MNADDILFERRGAAGLITLNRPQALNAVTHGMVTALAARLAAWASDPAVTRVIIRAAGDRAFSAGGDIRALYELGRAGRQADMLPFWRDEYRLNHLIKHYPKPYVALIDGIVMGGGVGISLHGSHRVAGEKFQFAMPEVGIGFFPDVGATWFLPRLPGQIGAYCALTGERLRAADGLAAGVATHHIAGARFPDLIDALAGTVSVDAVLAAFADQPLAPPRRARARWHGYARRSTGCSRPAALRAFLRRSMGPTIGTARGRGKPPPSSARSRRPASRWRSPRCVAEQIGLSPNACGRSSASSRASSMVTISTKACARPSSTRTTRRAGVRPTSPESRSARSRSILPRSRRNWR
jgi:enoyl-CoA hydratase/carnithine racemase